MSSDLEDKITGAVDKVSESVVSINSMRSARDFRFGTVPVEGMGSGVVVNSKGYIVTNNHVVSEAARVQVQLRDGRNLIGEVIGSDAPTDLALVRVQADDLPAAGLGDSEKLKVGAFVLAVGNALGLPGGPTVSAGVISAVGRMLPGADFIFEGFIQTDAAINPGNSGGPLADLRGEVIGINTAVIPSAHGVGFAIPVNTVKSVVEQILSEGRVVRPWLGIYGADVNAALVRRYALPVDSGVLVVDVSPGSPSYEAGLRAGDVLTQMGPHEVSCMKDLLVALSKLRIGEEVVLSLIRMGVEGRTSIRLVEAPRRVLGGWGRE